MTYEVYTNDEGYDFVQIPAEDVLRWAGVPRRYRWIEWDVQSPSMIVGAGIDTDDAVCVSDPVARKSLTWLSNWSREDEQRFVVLQAPQGRGKTTYAAATIRRAIGASPMWKSWPEIVKTVADSWSEGGEAWTLDPIIKAPFLVIDDFGKELAGGDGDRMASWQKRVAFDIVNGRYNKMLPTLFTTELAPDDMGNRLDAAITSRLLGDGRWIDLSAAPDYRI